MGTKVKPPHRTVVWLTGGGGKGKCEWQDEPSPPCAEGVMSGAVTKLVVPSGMCSSESRVWVNSNSK